MVYKPVHSAASHAARKADLASSRLSAIPPLAPMTSVVIPEQGAGPQVTTI